MKITQAFLLGTSLLLTACSVLLPQAAAPNEVGRPASGMEEVVVEAVEILPAGSLSSEDIGTTTVEIIGGDEADLREFVEHFLGSTYPGQLADHITVYLGSLPQDLPYTLPIPETARVIGSVMQTLYTNVQVILETTLTPEAVVAFYEGSLPELGWVAVPDAGYQGGFVPGDLGPTYCLGDNTSLNIQAGTWADGATDVRIFTFSDRIYSPCNPNPQYGQDPVLGLIPVLKSPPGAAMNNSGGGGSSGDFSAYNEVQLQTERSAGEMAAFYNEQLEVAGWSLVESGESDGHAWSSWTFTDEKGQEWSGTLVLLEVPPGSDTIFAYIQVAR